MKFEFHFEFRASLKKFQDLNFWDGTSKFSHPRGDPRSALVVNLPLAIAAAQSRPAQPLTACNTARHGDPNPNSLRKYILNNNANTRVASSP
jgi:hypothetical protein